MRKLKKGEKRGTDVGRDRIEFLRKRKRACRRLEKKESRDAIALKRKIPLTLVTVCSIDEGEEGGKKTIKRNLYRKKWGLGKERPRERGEDLSILSMSNEENSILGGGKLLEESMGRGGRGGRRGVLKRSAVCRSGGMGRSSTENTAEKRLGGGIRKERTSFSML